MVFDMMQVEFADMNRCLICCLVGLFSTGRLVVGCRSVPTDMGFLAVSCWYLLEFMGI
jgi:hypothetical protein